MINDNIVLTGSVDTPQAAAKVVRLAQIFITGGENTAGGGAAGGSGTTIVLGEEDKPQSQVVNMLRIDGEDQVHLKVVIAEIQRSIVKQLGINTNFSNASTDGFGFSTFSSASPSLTQLANASGVMNLTDPLGTLSATYQALERNGVMRTLAEPSLTAVSGEQAHFKVGGTYQVPSSVSNDESGAVSVSYTETEYGVALTFTPVVLTAGRISLKIRTEVSEPTAQDVRALRNDVNLFSVRKRLADTTVEIPSGGSMVIGGLVHDDVRQAVSGHPALMNIPFFGALFRSKEFVRNESEVVVIVTPYLVRPTARSKLIQPDENFQAASDAAGYFMGRINRVYGTKQGDLPKGRYTGAIGFILK
jgi:pilus assembly protein CpaC